MNNRITLYLQKLNLQNATFSRIDHEDAMVADVYKITQPTGAPLILKICTRTNDYLHEVYFLNYFANTLPVPRIIEVVPPEVGIDGAILMECLSGTPVKITEYTNELAYEAGSLLARIHLNRVARYGDIIQPDMLSSDPRTYFTMKFEEIFAECSNHLPKALLDQCRAYYDTHIDLLMTVDGPCIIHRDFRPGNIIVSDGKLQGLIDWSAACAYFAEEDFCNMEYTEWSRDITTKKSFLSGYASIRPVPDYRAMMPLLLLSKALDIIGFTVKSGTWNGSHARIYQFSRQFLESFF